jgi:hypothetical protein
VASTKPSIRVGKSFLFRGSARVWSNRYYMTGPVPADSTHWTTLSDLVVNAEKAALFNVHTIVKTEGFAAGSDVPVFTKTYTAAGTLSLGSQWLQQGEVCALVRYSTSGRTSKNHPIYLFNYYHGVASVGVGVPDTLYATEATALQTYANAWVAGFNDGSNVQVRCGPQGDVATAALVETLLTHRDFPRD